MDFESLIYLQVTSYVVLVGLFVLFPKDCILLLAMVPLWIKAVVLNYSLMLKAWMVHRQISKDFASMGLPPPAFKFTPIWKR
jgi:hypothetical protein